MIVKTVDLTRLYRIGSSTVVGVKGINISIDESSFLAIMGPSGSGKTTLLNLLGLIDQPTFGKVFFQGKDTTVLSGEELREIRLRHIGFIFQTFNLLPTLTALENVELPLALLGASQSRQKEGAKRLLEAVELSHRLQHLPNELSAGEMQRIAVARALVKRPSLVIADEPTGELDSKSGFEIIRLLLYACREIGAAVVVATHDEEIRKVADKVYRIRDGRIDER